MKRKKTRHHPKFKWVITLYCLQSRDKQVEKEVIKFGKQLRQKRLVIKPKPVQPSSLTATTEATQ